MVVVLDKKLKKSIQKTPVKVVAPSEKKDEYAEEPPEETYETTPMIEKAREEREKMEAVVEKMKAENDRQEQIQIKKQLGGMAEAGQVAEPPKKMSDTEYAEALERGEVNPLKEDGFV